MVRRLFWPVFPLLAHAACFSSTVSTLTASASGSGSGSGTTGASTSESATSGSTSSSGAGGAATSGDWSCLGKTMWPAPTAAKVNHTVQMTLFPAMNPGSNLEVKACALGDEACTNPVVLGTSDASGSITLSLPTAPSGFDGYLEVAAPTPTLLMLYPPVAIDGVKELRYVGDAQFLPLFAQTSGVTVDGKRGLLGVQAFDCKNQSGPGVSYSIDSSDAETKVLYLVGSVNYSDKVDRTGTTGLAAIANILPGTANVTAKVAETGALIATVPIVVRAGTVTSISVPVVP